MNARTRTIGKVVLGVAAVCTAAVLLTKEWRDLDAAKKGHTRVPLPLGPEFQRFRPVQANAPQPIAYWPPDNRGPVRELRRREAKDRAESVVARIASDDPATRAAGVAALNDLPLDAFPVLASATTRPGLSAKGQAALRAALTPYQSRVRTAMAVQRSRAWHQATLLDVFDNTAPPQAPWAKPARLELEAYALVSGHDPVATEDENGIIYREAWYAVTAGCRDPMVEFVRARNLELYDSDTDKVAAAYDAAANDLYAGHYAPYWQLNAALRAALYWGRHKPRDAAGRAVEERHLEKARALLPRVLADQDMPLRNLWGIFINAGEASDAVYGDRSRFVAPMLKMLESSHFSRSIFLSLEGDYLIAYAWDARGTGYADTVTESGGRLFGQRLAQAREVLEPAWALDPTNLIAPYKMLEVELGQGNGRDEMERWFRRAVDADPYFYSSYTQKMRYLQPKWYGSIDDVVAFGRECVKEGNWDTGAPYALIDAHIAASTYTGNAPDGQVDPSYFRTPGVWEDVRSVFPELIRHHPDSVHLKLRYAHVAYMCGAWAEAHQMFEEAYGYYDADIFGPEENQKKEQREAAAKAEEAAKAPTSRSTK